jgi:hypothetical protein
MWIARLSPAVLWTILFSCSLLFIVLPNILVRTLDNPGLVRPTFLVCGVITISVISVLGLYAEGMKLYFDRVYRGANSNLPRYILISVGFAAVVVFCLPLGARYVKDLYGVYVLHTPLREVTGTIKHRSGLAAILGEGLQLTDGSYLNLPYSDLPAVGGTYTFTMLPTENVVTYYQPLDH